MTEKHKAALVAGRKRAALKRSTSAPRMQRGKPKPSNYHISHSKVEVDAFGRVHATYRVRGKGFGPGGRQIQLHEPPPVVDKEAQGYSITKEMRDDDAYEGAHPKVENVLAPVNTGFPFTLVDKSASSPTVTLTNRINDAMLDVVRDRERWLERKRAFDLLDTRDENYLNAMSRVGLAFISYIHAAQEFKRLTSINAEA